MRKFALTLRSMMRRLAGVYRPEKHYMRGSQTEA